jgi:transcriptional regulator with XRE-family HTH domain
MLADRLHITDKAVSKWERGLSYPDLTLLEPLAEALELSTAELLACCKDPAEDVKNLLHIAKESNRSLHKRFRWVIAVMVTVAILVVGAALWYAFRTETATIYAKVWSKQTTGQGGIIYVEKDHRLLALTCDDRAMFDSIPLDSRDYFLLTYRWCPRTYRGVLKSCQIVPEEEIGFPATGGVGSSIGVESLLGVPYAWKEISAAYDDPQREYGYLFTYRFYYKGDGQHPYIENTLKETTLLIVQNCRKTLWGDFDGDGIVELFVLTCYDEAPYMIYDLVDGHIVGEVVSQVPPQIENCLHTP